MFKRFALIAATLSLISSTLLSDEGMYPISEIHKLDLRGAGLQLDAKEIFNPDGVSLIDAIVRVGGCSGSFVSPEGLIITNHHCVFSAVQAASTAENDLLTNGFLAKTRKGEIQATGLTVRITESYRDVSSEVMAALSDTLPLAERTKAITRRTREIVAEAEKINPGKRAEVAEMFAGKTYVLFLYTYIRDVRLVYVPPRSIGEFGGETDNWVWPRHTGDFSFVRPYVAPDGSFADYSPNNVPFVPRKHLKVQPDGVDEEDFVFILGYPGRTYRHQTSHYLTYEQNIRLPYVASLNEWQIEVMERMGKKDPGVALKHAPRLKSLANVMKNYRGKLKGMKNLGLVERKRNEERRVQQFIDADAGRKAIYGSVLDEIADVYAEMTASAMYELTLDNLVSSPRIMALAATVFDATVELQKPDIERKSEYTERNLPRTRENLQSLVKNFHEPTDRMVLKEMLMKASMLPDNQRIAGVDQLFGGENPEKKIDQFIESSYRTTILTDEGTVLAALTKSTDDLAQLKDPFIELVTTLDPERGRLHATRQQRSGALSKLSALLIDVKQQFLKTDFIPDANSTLRLTYGRIRGYSPADALYSRPITTLAGVMEKTTGDEPFDTPQKVIELYKARDFGRYKSKKLNTVPVGLLYNLDTTGGNSGSALLNANGELVGVNFDRAFEATVNDYAWSENYSRSIAVDIRYVLWVTDKVGGAEQLLKEMGVVR